ncbi:hypothetical protein ACJIZ3_016264 [Penstemon smallii]|uniref:COP9 signalosome complex subunit 7 n=1 Tax=Penstemon smallii TaxID=265156 RepID=A0ABD3RT43_9LAMI
MDIEQKQVEHIDYFVKQALNLSGSALQNVVVEATSHPSHFALSEILSVPSTLEFMCSAFLDLLRMFAHGTWSVASRLPQLVPEQILKLNQLTVLTLADTNKLEDFLINDCMYVGIVRGKLDQLRKCFEVQFAAGRDLRPGQLGRMIQTLASWLSTSDNLLVSIQGKIKWADNMSRQEAQKEVDERVEEPNHVTLHHRQIVLLNLWLI